MPTVSTRKSPRLIYTLKLEIHLSSVWRLDRQTGLLFVRKEAEGIGNNKSPKGYNIMCVSTHVDEMRYVNGDLCAHEL